MAETHTTRDPGVPAVRIAGAVPPGVPAVAPLQVHQDGDGPALELSRDTAGPVIVVKGGAGISVRDALGIERASIAADGTISQQGTSLGSTYVTPQRIPSLFNGGRVVGWVGASITNGSSASNAATRSYRAMARNIVGSAYISGASLLAAYPGQTSSYILGQMPSMLSSSPDVVVIGPDYQTNSAGNAFTLAQMQADFIAAVDLSRASGATVVACTNLQRGSGTSAGTMSLVGIYNLWLREYCGRHGIPLADTYAATVDPATGYLLAAYDSGDAVHPNDAGHLALAQAISPVLRSAIPLGPWPVMAPDISVGMLSNPLMAGTSGSVPSGWLDYNGSYAGTRTFTSTAPSGGDLPAGQWLNMSLNGASGTGYRNFATTNLSGWSVGDELLLCAYVKCSDPIGTGLKVQFLDQTTAAATGGVRLDSPGVPTIGPVISRFTVPAGVTSLKLSLTGAVSAGQNITFSIGAVQVYNLTTLGLTGSYA